MSAISPRRTPPGPPYLPVAMNWDDALAYTSLSPKQLRSHEKAGRVRFRRFGRNGARIAMRSDLERLIADAFEAAVKPVEEDFDFG